MSLYQSQKFNLEETFILSILERLNKLLIYIKTEKDKTIKKNK